MKKLLLLVCILYSALTAQAQVVTTLAGSDSGFADGAGNTAKFFSPNGLCTDANGNIYVADALNYKIRKITPNGVVSTLAGSTQGYVDGQGSTAKFYLPSAIAIDMSGNLYVADNHKIRKITTGGMVTTFAGSDNGFADGLGNAAKFSAPTSIATDSNANVYVTDYNNNKIRKITPSGMVTTLAGSDQGFADGTGNTAKFSTLNGIATDSNANLYVSDSNKIRKVTLDGTVTTFAGSDQGFADGIGTAAKFYGPSGIAFDANGNLYVADMNNSKVRKITPNGTVTTLVGSDQGFADGIGNSAKFYFPIGVALDPNGNIFIADGVNNRIRKITSNACTTLNSLSFTLTQPTCEVGSNVAIVPLNGETYSLDGGPYTTSSVYNNLAAGFHTFVAKKTEGCISSVTSFSIMQPVTPDTPAVVLTQPNCSVPSGTVTISSVPDMMYCLDNGPYSTNSTYSGLAPNSSHTVTGKTSGGCISQIKYITLNALPNTPPVAITPSPADITLNTVKLSWSNPTSSSSWEIVVQPLGSAYPNGSGIAVSTNSYLAENLNPATQYQYYVRSQCIPGVFSSWGGPYIFNTLTCDEGNKCNYTFKMTDSGANGWAGATMQVRQNGIVVATIGSTFTGGAGPVNISVPLCNNVPFDLYWSSGGLQPTQCAVSVINSFGQTLFTKVAGTGATGQIVYNNIVNCDKPVCDVPPTSLEATSVTTNGATLSWSAPSTSAWDIYVVAAGSPAPTALTVPTYVSVSQIPFAITGLLADTSYDFYVRVVCSPNPSAWSASYNFWTLPTCPRPMGLSATAITKTGATLSWDNGAPTDTQWEILLVKAVAPTYGVPTVPSGNYILQPGDKLYSVSAPSPFVVNDLETSTIYYYYMKTLCSGSDKSVWEGPYKFNTLTCDTAQKCSYKFMMTDTGANNGWESGRMRITQNGISVINGTIGATMTTSNPVTATVSLCPNVPFELVWTAGGAHPEEMGIQVANPFGDLIYSKLPGEGKPLDVLFTSTGNCIPPSCPKPTLLKADYTSTSATLDWTENGTATKWEVYLVPTGTTPPVNGSPLSGQAPYYIATAKPFTINNLNLSTSYTYYVRALCSETDMSTWTLLTPQTFITKPLNDECSGAINVPVNTTNECVTFTSGNTFGATTSVPTTSPVCNGYSDDDIWFSFTATATTHVITLKNIVGTTTNLNHTLYSGSDCGTMTQVYCSNPDISVAKNLIPGNSYKIRVYTDVQTIASQTVTFDVCITTPPPVSNDDCTSAVALAVNNGLGCEASTPGFLTGASASSQPSACVGTADDDVWYKFVATSSVHYIILNNVIGIADINHAVYTGSCDGLTLKYCSVANSLTSNAKDFVEGETYYIRVWSNNAMPQSIDFNICIGSTLPPVTTSTSAYTTAELVKNVLINNPCISVSNIKSSTGTNYTSVNGLGYFSNPKKRSEFPLASGIVLSSGNALSISGPNSTILNEGGATWPGDIDLENTIKQHLPPTQSVYTQNATTLEFDFTSMNEFMSFNFLFASEEYGVFQCGYADAFAFLLTDKTTNTTTNLAVLPGTSTPVSVLNIRDQKFNKNCPSLNPAYFGSFFGTDGIEPLMAPINFNGITKLMTASSAIIPNNPYHIKLVIADNKDAGYDSAIFIQGGSFTSGPPECMDKVKLVAFVDANANGTKDSAESSFTYGSFTMLKNNTASTNISAPNGSYTLYESDPTNVYDFSFQINPDYAPYYSVAATNFNDINIPAGSGTNTLYFPVTVKQAYKDVSVTVIPMSEPVPGGIFVNKVVYKNSGTIAASGTISFTNPDAATISSISQSGTVQTTNGFTYDFTALAPGETRAFDVTMSIPATINIGDVLTSVASISANVSKSVFSGVVTSANSQIVVTSQASTAITEAHAQKIPFSTFKTNDYLTYTIRFQNTGSANAASVRIEDLLNEKLDLQSLQMLNASHNYVMERVGNKIVWKLDYINLVGALQSDALSRGYLTFKIKMLPGFAAGTVVPNKADIYFDSNDVVSTNNLNTEFVADQLSSPSFESQNILLFPNPASDIVQVRLQNSVEVLDSVVIYDLLGKTVHKLTRINADQSQLSIGDLAKGVYLVEITTKNQFRSTQKLIIK